MATLQQKTQCRQRHIVLSRRQQRRQQQTSQQQMCNNIANGKSFNNNKATTTTLEKQKIIENLILTPHRKQQRTIFCKQSQEFENLLPPEVLFQRRKQPFSQGSQISQYTKTLETTIPTTTKTSTTASKKVRQHRRNLLKSSNSNFTERTTTENKTIRNNLYLEHNKWGSSSIWRLDSTLCIMLTMFVVATVVISGNAAYASQRDSYKIKDAKGLANSVNAIPTGTFAISNGNNGNGSSTIANGGDTINIKTGTAASNRNIGTERSLSNNSVASVTSSSSTTNNIMNLNHTTVTTATTTLKATLSSSSSSSSSTTSKTAAAAATSIASGNLQKVGNVGANTPNGNIGINRNAIEIMEDIRSGPYFDKAASRNVTALLGKTAYLNCRVKNLGNKTMLLQVSWVRHRDIHLLTVGRYTYTSDQRFRAIHQPQTEDWILQIKYPQHRDSGIYECQVSTTPHMSHYIHLNVVEPSTEIIGAPDLYIESGSTINLTCVILNSPEPPAYIFWNHNNAIINYDSPRGGVSVVTNKGETTTSFLLIKTARPSDSGLYQCNPSNAKPKSVTVHVLNGEFPAAMQRAALGLHRMSQSHYLLVYLFMYLFTLVYVGRFMELSPQPVQLLQPTSQIVGIIPRSNAVKIVNNNNSSIPKRRFY